MILGVRSNGDRLILDETNKPEKAQHKAMLFREHLEGYAAIEVEDVMAAFKLNEVRS